MCGSTCIGGQHRVLYVTYVRGRLPRDGGVHVVGFAVPPAVAHRAEQGEDVHPRHAGIPFQGFDDLRIDEMPRAGFDLLAHLVDDRGGHGPRQATLIGGHGDAKMRAPLIGHARGAGCAVPVDVHLAFV